MTVQQSVMETGAVIAPRPFLTVKEVMILMGCKQDKAYKTMRKINLESEREGYMRFDSGKVNKHVFAKKLQIPEEDIEKAIQYVAAQSSEIGGKDGILQNLS